MSKTTLLRSKLCFNYKFSFAGEFSFCETVSGRARPCKKPPHACTFIAAWLIINTWLFLSSGFTTGVTARQTERAGIYSKKESNTDDPEENVRDFFPSFSCYFLYIPFNFWKALNGEHRSDRKQISHWGVSPNKFKDQLIGIPFFSSQKKKKEAGGRGFVWQQQGEGQQHSWSSDLWHIGLEQSAGCV